MEDTPQTYSVSFRVRRTTVEYGYVSVPVTRDLMIVQPDGTGRLNVEEMVSRGVELAGLPDVCWHPESQEIDMHPLQRAPEPGES